MSKKTIKSIVRLKTRDMSGMRKRLKKKNHEWLLILIYCSNRDIHNRVITHLLLPFIYLL